MGRSKWEEACHAFADNMRIKVPKEKGEAKRPSVD